MYEGIMKRSVMCVYVCVCVLVQVSVASTEKDHLVNEKDILIRVKTLVFCFYVRIFYH